MCSSYICIIRKAIQFDDSAVTAMHSTQWQDAWELGWTTIECSGVLIGW